MMTNKHAGSSFDSWLEKEGILDECELAFYKKAENEVLDQISEVMITLKKANELLQGAPNIVNLTLQHINLQHEVFIKTGVVAAFNENKEGVELAISSLDDLQKKFIALINNVKELRG